MALQRVAPAADYAAIFEPRGNGGPSGLARPSAAVRLSRAPSRRPDHSRRGRVSFPVEPLHARRGRPRADGSSLRRCGARRSRAGTRQGGVAETSGEPVSIDLLASHGGARQSPGRLPLAHRAQTRRAASSTVPSSRSCLRASATAWARYGRSTAAGPLDIDFAAMGARAAGGADAALRVAAGRCRAAQQPHRADPPDRRLHRDARSTRAPLAEFLPYLEAAHWTGVGRQAVWGKGEIALRFE